MVDVIMYLTNKFKTNVKKKVQEATAKARTEEYQLWAAWNTRRIKAETKGLPFDEPPPDPPVEDKKILTNV